MSERGGDKESKPAMRVLILSEQGVGGNRWWADSIPLLASTGVEVLSVTVREPGALLANYEREVLNEELRAQGIATRSLDCRTSRDYPRAMLRLASWIRRERIDIIHCNEPIPAVIGGVAGLLARRGVRIFHRHHTGVDDRKQELISRTGARLAQLVMAISQAAANHAQRFEDVPTGRIRIAYNGVQEMRAVERDEASALRARLGIADADPVILIVARMRPEKGHLMLLDAVERVAASPELRQSGNLHLVVVGSGPEESRIRERAGEIASSVNVHFAGTQADIAPWFAISNVVAMPSSREPFGLVAIEAMAARRPLVAGKVEGLLEVVGDEESGLLVEPRDSEAWAAALVRVLCSPEFAARLAANGYERFRQRFTLEKMVAAWRACYDEALEMYAPHGQRRGREKIDATTKRDAAASTVRFEKVD